jgi:hypothetical protein
MVNHDKLMWFRRERKIQLLGSHSLWTEYKW